MLPEQFKKMMDKLEEIRCGIIDAETEVSKNPSNHKCHQCKGTKKVKIWMPGRLKPCIAPCGICVKKGECVPTGELEK